MTTVNRVLAAPLLLLLRLYQQFISPLRPPTCRYYPSCSAYAVTAVTRFGPFKGAWLAMLRLGRCHPWTPGGVDEVPPTWEQRHERPEFRPPDLDEAPAPSRHAHLTTRQTGSAHQR